MTGDSDNSEVKKMHQDGISFCPSLHSRLITALTIPTSPFRKFCEEETIDKYKKPANRMNFKWLSKYYYSIEANKQFIYLFLLWCFRDLDFLNAFLSWSLCHCGQWVRYNLIWPTHVKIALKILCGLHCSANIELYHTSILLISKRPWV